MASKLGVAKKASTHKGRKIMQARESKVIENDKRCMVMKGRKSSATINDLLKEMQLLKGREACQMLCRGTHDILPMEDASLIENQGGKYDCSLFAVGSHQKKRPDNLVLGRLFDNHVLDMFEFGVANYRSASEFPAAEHIVPELKPILIFQGEQFETSDRHKRLKSLLIDLFKQRELQEANIQELKRVMVFTCRGELEPIEFRHLECDNITEATVSMQTVPFREVGPSFSLKLRRDKMAGADLFKEACKKPKVRNVEKKRADKNKFTTVLGEKKGKVFVQQQDLDTLNLRKYKGMGKPPVKTAQGKPASLQAQDV